MKRMMMCAIYSLNCKRSHSPLTLTSDPSFSSPSQTEEALELRPTRALMRLPADPSLPLKDKSPPPAPEPLFLEPDWRERLDEKEVSLTARQRGRRECLVVILVVILVAILVAIVLVVVVVVNVVVNVVVVVVMVVLLLLLVCAVGVVAGVVGWSCYNRRENAQ